MAIPTSGQDISLMTNFLVYGINGTSLDPYLCGGCIQAYLRDSWYWLCWQKRKESNIIHRVKCPAEFISSCFNNYLTFSFPLCVVARVIGPKLNSQRSSTSIPMLFQVVTIWIPYIIGIRLNKTLGTLLVILLEIDSLFLLVNSVPTPINIGSPLPPRKI